MLFQILFGSGRVVAFTVHEGPNPPSDRMDRAEALRFVKDGFSLAAALTAPVWLLSHSLWAALAVYGLAVAAIALAYAAGLIPDFAALIALAALHVIVGFEADTIERLDLEQKGWSTLGSVTGGNALECERRFFDRWLPLQPVLSGGGPAALASSESRTSSHAQAQVTSKPAEPSAVATQPGVVRSSRSPAARLAALWRKS